MERVRAASFHRTTRARAATLGLALLAAATGAATMLAGMAGAQTGGTAAPPDPVITDVRCLSKCIKTRKGVVGSKLLVMGTDLRQAKVVSLPRGDGRRAKDMSPYVKPSGNVVAYARKGAITGAVRVADPYSMEESPIAFSIGTAAQLRKVQMRTIFPIRGPHTYGDGIGAPRGDHRHQGQDVMARCGTKLVAARGGRVQYRGYQAGGAGFYIVIDGFKSRFDFVYMHLKGPAWAATGRSVTTGQQIGRVGSTGSSSACHLHFEMWGLPGWYEGGQFINPTPRLKYWDSYS